MTRLSLHVYVCTIVLSSSLVALLAEDKPELCDDGKYKIWRDMESYECREDQRLFVISEYYSPAGTSECTNTTKPAMQCMDVSIHYDTRPPTSGDYRPQGPKYGTYSYLPPQRWLHALEFGAVAFLYHPCAPADQVLTLKDLARQCLWKHLVTPYLDLDPTHPFALVSWGCVYRMTWVNPTEVRQWVREHALQTQLSYIDREGPYEEGLLEQAVVVSTASDEMLCPQEEPSDSHTGHGTELPSQASLPHPTNSTPISPPHGPSGDIDDKPDKVSEWPSGMTNNCSGTTCLPPTEHILVVLHTHHPALITLIVVTSLALVAMVTLICWRLFGCVCCKLRRKRRSRYKKVSKFFPFSYGKEPQGDDGMALPELGPPKIMGAERETLLNDSDDDSI